MINEWSCYIVYNVMDYYTKLPNHYANGTEFAMIKITGADCRQPGLIPHKIIDIYHGSYFLDIFEYLNSLHKSSIL